MNNYFIEHELKKLAALEKYLRKKKRRKKIIYLALYSTIPIFLGFRFGLKIEWLFILAGFWPIFCDIASYNTVELLIKFKKEKYVEIS